MSWVVRLNFSFVLAYHLDHIIILVNEVYHWLETLLQPVQHGYLWVIRAEAMVKEALAVLRSVTSLPRKYCATHLA